MACAGRVLESRAGSLAGSGKGVSVPAANDLNWTVNVELHGICVCANLGRLCEC